MNKTILAGIAALGITSSPVVSANCQQTAQGVHKVMGQKGLCIDGPTLQTLDCFIKNGETPKVRLQLIEQKVEQMLSLICDHENYDTIRQELISFYIEAATDGNISMADRVNEILITIPTNRIIFSAELDK